MDNVIPRKARPFPDYIYGTVSTLKKKYKISDYDIQKLESEMIHSFEYALRDELEDGIKLYRIKQEVGGVIKKSDLANVITFCKKTIKEMMALQLDWSDDVLSKFSELNGYSKCEKGDADAPFYSECFLYNLIGKEDARSVLYPMEALAEKLGVTNE